MNLLPLHTETIVSSLTKEEVLDHLRRVTREVNFLDVNQIADEKIQFNGLVGQRGFRISRAIKKGETFLPLITGDVESTPRGSIIFLRFRLFPSALFFLVFWSVVLLCFAGYYFGFMKIIESGLLCLCLALANYALGVFFFHRQVRLSRKVFFQLFNLQMKDKE